MPDITLTMTLEEAQALRTILSNIGGSPIRSRRRHMDTVAAKLDRMQIYGDSSDIMPDMHAIFFRDDERRKYGRRSPRSRGALERLSSGRRSTDKR